MCQHGPNLSSDVATKLDHGLRCLAATSTDITLVRLLHDLESLAHARGDETAGHLTLLVESVWEGWRVDRDESQWTMWRDRILLRPYCRGISLVVSVVIGRSAREVGSYVPHQSHLATEPGPWWDDIEALRVALPDRYAKADAARAARLAAEVKARGDARAADRLAAVEAYLAARR